LAAAFLLMPVIIRLAKRLKLRQTVLHYVEEHKKKSGTPTMGGIGFIAPLLLSLFFARGQMTLLLVTVGVTIAYGIVGFLDDFLKVYFKRNDGLKPWQKIIFQLSIAAAVSVFAYLNPSAGGSVYLFFGFSEIYLGWFVVPLFVLVFVALTNSVNLTDGLDGLAGGVTIVYTVFFAAILYLCIALGVGHVASDGSGQAAAELLNLIIFCAALVGGLVGFMFYNGYPAKIFMGDTGSLALGGALACLAIFSRRIMIVPFLGIMYLATALSVIIQVTYFKKTKGKRVFLMAPLHHHFQQKGVHEAKIGIVYSTVTAIMGALSLVLLLVFA